MVRRNSKAKPHHPLQFWPSGMIICPRLQRPMDSLNQHKTTLCIRTTLHNKNNFSLSNSTNKISGVVLRNQLLHGSQECDGTLLPHKDRPKSVFTPLVKSNDERPTAMINPKFKSLWFNEKVSIAPHPDKKLTRENWLLKPWGPPITVSHGGAGPVRWLVAP